jgi:hypothetical protein
MVNLQNPLNPKSASESDKAGYTPVLSGLDDQQAKNFIRQRFAEVYGAHIAYFLPQLLTLRDDNQQIHAALGLNRAADRHLFLERYLELPIEEALSPYLDSKPRRHGIVEVGNLAVADRGASRSLIAALSAYLFAHKLQWAVFTIGPLLINSFRRLGIDLIDLGPANIDCLSLEEQADWGNYYEHGPRVMVTSVSQTYQSLKQYHLCEGFAASHWGQEG